MSNMLSWPGRARAGRSPARCGDGRVAMVRAPTEPALPRARPCLASRAPRGARGRGAVREFFSCAEARERSGGWEKNTRHFWRLDYQAFLEFFFAQCFTESHSTKHIEDAVGWGGEIG